MNFLTIVTEFIGVSLALGYFGVSPYISVPLAALGLVVDDRQWQLPALGAVHARVHRGELPRDPPRDLRPSPRRARVQATSSRRASHGGFNSTSVLLIIAIVGTTVAPWQLFFQQSNIVDKRITPRWINYERVDTVLGSFITVLAASLIIITVAVRLRPHPRRRGNSPTPAGSRTASTTTWATPPARCSPSSC